MFSWFHAQLMQDLKTRTSTVDKYNRRMSWADLALHVCHILSIVLNTRYLDQPLPPALIRRQVFPVDCASFRFLLFVLQEQDCFCSLEYSRHCISAEQSSVTTRDKRNFPIRVELYCKPDISSLPSNRILVSVTLIISNTEAVFQGTSRPTTLC